jgi:hypothetical protein
LFLCIDWVKRTTGACEHSVCSRWVSLRFLSLSTFVYPIKLCLHAGEINNPDVRVAGEINDDMVTGIVGVCNPNVALCKSLVTFVGVQPVVRDLEISIQPIFRELGGPHVSQTFPRISLASKVRTAILYRQLETAQTKDTLDRIWISRLLGNGA